MKVVVFVVKSQKEVVDSTVSCSTNWVELEGKILSVEFVVLSEEANTGCQYELEIPKGITKIVLANKNKTP